MTGEIEHGWVTVDAPDASEVNAGNLNDHIIDYDALAAALGAGAGTVCIAQRTTSQAISGTGTAVAFTATDILDDDGWHDPGGANPSRLTCPTGKGGVPFLVVGSIEWGGGSGHNVTLRVNGTTIFANLNMGNYTVAIAGVYVLADGDYVEMLMQTITNNSYVTTDAPLTLAVASLVGPQGPEGEPGAPSDPAVAAAARIYVAQNFR